MSDRAPTTRQLPLSLPHRAAMTRADYLVGEANRPAVALIDGWPVWPDRAVLLSGPAGSGKTHLVEIWRHASGAAVATARRLGDVDALAAAPAVAVEDLHAGPLDEEGLFHLINLSGERRLPLLMTSRAPAGGLSLRLPDLASRLRAARAIALGEPDDSLLRLVLVKLFADRQLTVDADVIETILTRMERSLEAASRIVDELDREALAGGRAISRRLAAETLARVIDHQPDLFADPD
jgi:chromosomal replication initiation ATPase DnaA